MAIVLADVFLGVALGRADEKAPAQKPPKPSTQPAPADPSEKTAGMAVVLASALPTPDMSPPRSPAQLSARNNECTFCHKADATLSHPINVRPTMALPPNLPLVDGKIACITCHTADEAEHDIAQTVHNALLPPPGRGVAFCVQCHDDSDLHGSRLGRAHLYWPDHRGPALAQATGGMDAVSRDCLICHDGAIGRAKSLGNSHPIGIRYEKRSPGGMGLVPASMLDSRVRLIDNLVSCVSCHNPYTSDSKRLVMPNTRSELCTSCHRVR